MSIAQQIGQWLGLVIIGTLGGYIGYRILRLALWVRDLLEGRRRDAAFAELVGEPVASVLADARPHEWGDVRKYGQPPRPELMIASPPCEMPRKFPRGVYPRAVVTSSRQGGKTEDARRQLERLHADTLSTPYCLRPYLFGGSSLDSMAAGLILRQATKTSRPPGEIAVGVCLDLERDFLDGDRPSLTEPRGIFHQ